LDHRRIFKRALAGLKNEPGDMKALGDNLADFYRLRIGAFRVIFRHQPRRVIECVYANRRGLVYDVFEREMIERLK
jgi:mRNA-degrading endonuclease RelE of RelBE toxin-antitoxin system